MFLPMLAWAQDARSILDNTASAIRNQGAAHISFTASTFQGTTFMESMDGKMSIDGQKFRLESAGLSLWYDGTTQWSYLHESNEVDITEPTLEEIERINPYAFLNIYKKGYKLSVKKKQLRGKPSYEVRLRAQSKQQEVEEIYVDVTQADFTPLCVRVKQDGNWSRITIHSIQGKQRFPADYFSFKASEHPDVEVIDLR